LGTKAGFDFSADTRHKHTRTHARACAGARACITEHTRVNAPAVTYTLLCKPIMPDQCKLK